MSNPTHSHDLAQVFVPEAQHRLDELDNALEALFSSGPTPALMEAIYRTSFTLKTLAAGFDQQQIVEYITEHLDPNFNRLRILAQKPTATFQKTLQDALDGLREMFTHIAQSAQADANSQPAEPAQAPKELPETTKITAYEDIPTMLMAVGQMSIWSFHDITNFLAKIQGYAEMLDDLHGSLSQAKTGQDISETVSELKTIQKKITENTNSIAASIARIRAARGIVRAEKQVLPLRKLVENLMRNTVFTKYNVTWSPSMLPDVLVECNQAVFELSWIFLWRLLAEWMEPGMAAKAMCSSRIQIAAGAEPYPDKVFLYIWMEAHNAPPQKFIPEKLMTLKDSTPLLDLGNVFKVTASVARQTGIDIFSSQSPNGTAIFGISVNCRVNDTKEETKIPSQHKEAAPSSEPKPAKPAAPVTIAPAQERPYVLVVDDEKDLRSLLITKISKMGVPVVAAESIEEARKILNTKSVKVILADLFLSQESGLDLLREVKSSWPDVAFLFMSGANEDDVPAAILQVLSKYANAFLRKPIPTSLLKESIMKYYETVQ